MGLLSATLSFNQYHIEGELTEPVVETVAEGLLQNAFTDIEDDVSPKSAGWTSFEHPYQPRFADQSFCFGAYFVFCLRIDKKSIPAKMLKKHYTLELNKRQDELGTPYLSTNDKKRIKDHVSNMLYMRMPSTPNLHDIVWNYASRTLTFFSSLKSANEELETLFHRSFGLQLIRLFPFTLADLRSGLSDSQRDRLIKLTPTPFKA